MRIRCGGLMLLLMAVRLLGQAPDVPVYSETRETRSYADLLTAAATVRDSGLPLKAGAAREQLRRYSCRLELPKPGRTKLTPREVWQRARAGYVRVGWFYSSEQAGEWRFAPGGGYVITADGAAATVYHVVDPPRDLREGCLIAADDNGKVFPVIEVLAANRDSDVCILRIQSGGFRPLALDTNATPGDTVYCLSDPAGRRGYFSQGIVNRFFQLPERRLPNEPGAPLFAPTRINVSADWSSGSSGAPVLDECGNVIGHVSTVSVEGAHRSAGSATGQEPANAIIFHEAVNAPDVLALVKPTR